MSEGRHAPRTTTDPVELVAVGLDHTTAAIELRERMAFADGDIPAALAQLTEAPDPLLEQAAILSTCNRVELYGVARSAPSRDQLVSFLAGFHAVDPRELGGALYVQRGEEVAHHLAATTAGLHSLVLGEAQIQGQVRTALDRALAAGTAGPELRRLFESAVAAGRRVRSRTLIGRGVASVPHASVELARQRLGTLRESTVLLIGAGTAAELTAKHLAKRGVGELLVLGRDAERAARLAQRHHGHAVRSDRLVDSLAQADVVVSSTAAPGLIVQLHHVALARERCNRSRPLLLIDLAVPRDVDPAVARLPGVELYTVDELVEVVGQTRTRRRAELPAAYCVLGAEVGRFTSWLSRREVLAW